MAHFVDSQKLSAAPTGTGVAAGAAEAAGATGPEGTGATGAHLRVLGHWYFDAEHGFWLDEVMCRIFALHDHHEWHAPEAVMRCISPFDAARFWLNMKLEMMGEILFERISFQSGPYVGQNFIIQGSILARDSMGHALYATGYISHESSPYSEFIPREISGDGMFLLNVAKDELITSASFHKMLGFSADEFPKSSRQLHEDLVHPDDIDAVLVQNQIITTNLYGDYFECCQRLKHRDGHYVWTIGRALVLDRDQNHVATQLIGTITDIHLVQNSFDTMKLMMFNDSLTGLHNRTYFQQNAVRYADPKLQPLSIIFVDVTGLKLTNDILGHSYGDYLIIKTCEIIRQALSEELSAHLKTTPAEASSAPAAHAAAAAQPQHPHKQHRKASPAPATPNPAPAPQSEPPEAEAAEAQPMRMGLGPSASMAAQHALASAYGVETAESDATHAAAAAVAAAQKAEARAALEQKNQEHLQRLHEALASTGIDIIRLAGDEFLVILPNCTSETARDIKARLKAVRDSLNLYHETHTSIEERPVPVCFGVGVATMGDECPEGAAAGGDSLKNIIDRADRRMQEDKEAQRQSDYGYLKRYFEQKKGRPVSMRDDRRYSYLSEEERDTIRQKKGISRMLF